MPGKEGSNDDIIGFKKDTFIEIIKWGAIAGAVEGAINFIGGSLMFLFSWFGLFASAVGIFSILELINDVFWGAFSGVILAVIVIKFYDKIPFKTLFMKLFGIALIVHIVFSFLLGAIIIVFAGPLSFLVMLVSLIVADYVYAKIVVSKLGSVVNLK